METKWYEDLADNGWYDLKAYMHGRDRGVSFTLADDAKRLLDEDVVSVQDFEWALKHEWHRDGDGDVIAFEHCHWHGSYAHEAWAWSNFRTAVSALRHSLAQHARDYEGFTSKYGDHRNVWDNDCRIFAKPGTAGWLLLAQLVQQEEGDGPLDEDDYTELKTDMILDWAEEEIAQLRGTEEEKTERFFPGLEDRDIIQWMRQQVEERHNDLYFEWPDEPVTKDDCYL